MITLRAGHLVLVLAPECGGSIAAFYSDQDGTRRDWFRPAATEDLLAGNSLGVGCFPMAPFCNRLRAGAFRFEGRDFFLPPNLRGERHAIHGLVWQRPWTIEAAGPARVRLRTADDGRFWPSAFTVHQLFELTPQCLRVTLEVHNEGAQRMPAGLGLHPFLVHRAGAMLRARLGEAWEVDEERLPTGMRASLPQGGWKPEGERIEALELDNCFSGWDGVAQVSWPDASSLLIAATPPLRYLSIFVPSGRDYFCLEPVSQVPDWLNAGPANASAAGGALLDPGERLAASCEFRPKPAPARPRKNEARNNERNRDA